MALDIYTGVLTAKQIVTQAERRAGNPGLHVIPDGTEPTSGTMMDAPAYAALQMILDHLATTQTFTFTRTALMVTINARNNSLPPSYWRVGFADPCFLIDQVSNQRTPFYLLDAQEFHKRFQDGIVGRPYLGYINRNSDPAIGGSIIVDPAPDAEYTLELHYYPWQPALADKDAQPWLPYSQYLVAALLCDLYLHQDDTRWQQANAERARLMKDIKGAMGDDKDRASAKLELDPAMYPRPIEL